MFQMAPKNKENSATSRKKKVVSEDEDDEDYRRRRDRNNQVREYFLEIFMRKKKYMKINKSLHHLQLQAVKRSRVKSKMRTQQTLERVNQLKTENELLEEKIKMLTKELGFLKDLFLAHAGNYQRRVLSITFEFTSVVYLPHKLFYTNNFL